MTNPAPPLTPYPNAPHSAVEYPKVQLYGHDTVSPTSAHFGGSGVDGDFAHWQQTKKLEGFNLGTFGIVGADGVGYQGFSSRFWANHLGVTSATFRKYGLPNINQRLNQRSVGWEMDCLGPLEIAPDGGFRTVVKHYQKGALGRLRIPKENVQHYPDGFRGYYYFERYTPAQIEFTRRIFLYICERYKIPTDYNEDQWDVSVRALKGEPGIWQHVSVRPDKTDCHPQPEYVQMLQGLKPRIVVPVNVEPVAEPEPPPAPPEPEVPTKPETEPIPPPADAIPPGCLAFKIFGK